MRETGLKYRIKRPHSQPYTFGHVSGQRPTTASLTDIKKQKKINKIPKICQKCCQLFLAEMKSLLLQRA